MKKNIASFLKLTVDVSLVCMWFDFEMAPTGSCVWSLGPQLAWCNIIDQLHFQPRLLWPLISKMCVLTTYSFSHEILHDHCHGEQYAPTRWAQINYFPFKVFLSSVGSHTDPRLSLGPWGNGKGNFCYIACRSRFGKTGSGLELVPYRSWGCDFFPSLLPPSCGYQFLGSCVSGILHYLCQLV